MNSKLLITIAIALFLVFGTLGAIKWAQGYRFNTQQVALEGTGLLVANSQPEGASVYLNDELVTATDDTLHLSPGNYSVRIEKDGFSSWQKLITIEQELVTQTNVRLFPSVPSLSALTVNGASKPHPSPDGQKIAYQIASSSAVLKHGIWVTKLTDGILKFGGSSIQIVQDTPDLPFSQAALFWTPNSNQILAYFDENRSYLLNTDGLNEPENLLNVSFQLSTLIRDWQEQVLLELQKRLSKLPPAVQNIATTSATLLYFSPNEEKLLYTATAPTTIPENLIPPLPAINSQPQERRLKAGNLYIYDLKEDTNFLVLSDVFDETKLTQIETDFDFKYYLDLDPLANLLLATSEPQPTNNKQVNSPLSNNRDEMTDFTKLVNLQAQYSPVYSHNLIQWFPNSQHLIVTLADRISIIEYDGTNLVPIFSGIYSENFAYPWPNGEKMIILSSLTQDPEFSPNLYTLNLE